MLKALTQGDLSAIPANGITYIPARVIRKADAEGFWKDLKAKIKAGKEAQAK